MREFKFLLGVILGTALCVSYVGVQAGRTEARRATPSEAAAKKPEPASIHMDPEKIHAHGSQILEAGGLRKQIDTYKKEARGNSEIVEGLEALAKKLEVAAEADNDV